MRNKGLVFLLLIGLMACEPSRHNVVSLNAYVQDESNGLIQVQNRKGYDLKLYNRPLDLWVAQELKGEWPTDSMVNQYRDQYDNYLYFILKISREGQDAIAKRLADGHQKLAEYKEKFSEVSDITNLPDKQPNPLREKSLKERLVIGGNLQVNRQKPVTVDAGLEIAYRITPRSEWGVGGAYRLKLEKGLSPGTVTDVVNLRSFYHYRIWRSVGIQANYELNYGLPRVEQPVEGLIKEWTTSGLVGIRNEQPFFKKLGGYVTIQYDFLHQPENPNGRWVVRFGFRLQNRQR